MAIEKYEAPVEIEVKFFDVNLDLTRTRLQNVGSVLKTPDRLMRRIVFGHEMNAAMTCTYGRVRDEGDVVTMSAKYSAVDGDISSQREVQVVVDNFDNAANILQAFGLTPTNYQENWRETWQLEDGTLVELERWPELPTYVEIEGASIPSLQKAASELGLSWASHTTVPTDQLYARHYSLTDNDLSAKLKDLRFD
ncbi:MAG TPA: hypothetical protein VF575_05010 [Candidatus Saccharimonadales bacterium]|jgi:adenylate cyclase class 2